MIKRNFFFGIMPYRTACWLLGKLVHPRAGYQLVYAERLGTPAWLHNFIYTYTVFADDPGPYNCGICTHSGTIIGWLII